MLFDEIEKGRNYGARENPQGHSPFFRVRVLEKVRRPGGNQVKVRHLTEPHHGLEEFLKPAQLVAPWGDVREIIRDEGRLQRLTESIASFPDRTVQRAVETVFAATGDDSIWCRPSGIVECDPTALQRVADRAQISEPVTRLAREAFTDRRGTLHLPFAAVEQVARVFAAAEPDTVALYIDGNEESSFARASAPYAGYARESYLTDDKPGWELARQWAGSKKEVSSLMRENRRLRDLVQLGVRLLLEQGADLEAARLQRQLYGP
jgi:hypothetical protein